MNLKSKTSNSLYQELAVSIGNNFVIPFRDVKAVPVRDSEISESC